MLDRMGSEHSVQLPVTIVPGLDRHPFSGASAATRGVNMIIAKNSCLDMGAFTVPLRKDSHCSTLDHLDLSTDAPAEHLRQLFRPFPASTLNRKPSLFTLRLLLKLLPCLHLLQLTSGVRSWVIPMGRLWSRWIISQSVG